ncbi:MAG: VOC family protein [Patescibacteria group bacterium]
MIAHAGVLTRDYKKAKKFYATVLKTLGYKMTQDYPKYKAAGFKQGGNTDFWLLEQKKFAPTHLAFLAKSKRSVQAFYKAALAAGGKDNGAPGFRTHYSPDYYAAFVYDQDGNNVEACYFGEKAPKA